MLVPDQVVYELWHPLPHPAGTVERTPTPGLPDGVRVTLGSKERCYYIHNVSLMMKKTYPAIST